MYYPQEGLPEEFIGPIGSPGEKGIPGLPGTDGKRLFKPSQLYTQNFPTLNFLIYVFFLKI
jgi:hypothetical protein